MKKYLCIQRSQPGACASPSSSQMKGMYAKFNAWQQTYRDNIVDIGGRLGTGNVVHSEGASEEPFVESKEVVGGFMVVAAKSLEEASEVARECPGLVSPGSSVEVREIVTP